MTRQCCGNRHNIHEISRKGVIFKNKEFKLINIFYVALNGIFKEATYLKLQVIQFFLYKTSHRFSSVTAEKLGK